MGRWVAFGVGTSDALVGVGDGVRLDGHVYRGDYKQRRRSLDVSDSLGGIGATRS